MQSDVNDKAAKKIIDPPIEWVRDEEGPIALIVRKDFRTDRTVFFTEADMEQQLGIIKHPKDAVILAHDHHAEPRTLQTCPECLVIRSGSCEMTLYDHERREVSVHILNEQDIVLVLGGGHGFRMLEDCEIVEIRAGSFPGDDSKAQF